MYPSDMETLQVLHSSGPAVVRKWVVGIELIIGDLCEMLT